MPGFEPMSEATVLPTEAQPLPRKICFQRNEENRKKGKKHQHISRADRYYAKQGNWMEEQTFHPD